MASGDPYQAGEPFIQGLSQAPLYVRVMPSPPGAAVNTSYVYTFYLFYSWNGCSNQVTWSCLSAIYLTNAVEDILFQEEEGIQSLLEYYACNLGVHEGKVYPHLCPQVTEVNDTRVLPLPGDWETVQVEVCGDLSEVIRVTYLQHGWNEIVRRLHTLCALTAVLWIAQLH